MTQEPDADDDPAARPGTRAGIRADALCADPREALARAAFRAARDAGTHRALRTRRRDDWRPARVRGRAGRRPTRDGER
ncbi:hypothetical protein GPZ77_21455 [Streptomyces sp. QHH-9511]|uniref:hypothetical protein n=1 Tax=Streptomyces sp. QHH-9511 TaxID=2684468 RepID=UPI0013171512|nr:hypothetical protein [Streptomyces sp. QHH-9511]QGZ50592.1 hypothetical protein GPZ77_21455 [Streptomyces sp. QHH-9511]